MNRIPIRILWLCGITAALAVMLGACGASRSLANIEQSPSWSSDGEWIVFTSLPNDARRTELVALNVDEALDGAGRETWVQLSQGFLEAISPDSPYLGYQEVDWSPDGDRIAFTASKVGGEVYAFDASCLTMPDTCADSLTLLSGGLSPYVRLLSWSPDSTRLLVREGDTLEEGEERVVWSVVKADGSQTVLWSYEPDILQQPAWSPDGARLVFAAYNEDTWDLRIADLDGGDATQFTHTPDLELNPTWSPDGKEVAFWTLANGQFNIYRQAINGGSPYCVTCDVQLFGGAGNNDDLRWSPDGARIAFTAPGKPGLFQHLPPTLVYLINPDGTDPVAIKIQGMVLELAWSPDGTRLAFTFRDYPGGGSESDIYLINADGSGLTNLTD